jgi:hypothetical protein
MEKKLPEQDDQEDGNEGGDDGYYVDAQEAGVEVVEYEENQDSGAGEEELCDHEWPGAQAQEVGHERVFFDCAKIYQVKREQAVGDAEDQQQDDYEQKPGAVLIHINELFFVASPAGGLPATAKQEKLQPRPSVPTPIPALPPADIFLRFFHKRSQKPRALRAARLRS